MAGVLRIGHSLSEGVAGTAHDIGNLGKSKLELLNTKKVRIRPSRRIDARGQIKIYDPDLAIIHKYLKHVNDGVFMDQQVRFYAFLPSIDANGNVLPHVRSILVITNEFIIYLRVISFFNHIKNHYFERSLILSEYLSNIVNYSIKKMPA